MIFELGPVSVIQRPQLFVRLVAVNRRITALVFGIFSFLDEIKSIQELTSMRIAASRVTLTPVAQRLRSWIW